MAGDLGVGWSFAQRRYKPLGPAVHNGFLW